MKLEQRNRLAKAALLEAKARLDGANSYMKETVREVFPVGTRIEVELGRATVVGRVERYGYDPSEFDVINEKTGKRRKVYATFNLEYGHLRIIE